MFIRVKLDKLTQLINIEHVKMVMQQENRVCVVFKRGQSPLILTMTSTPMAQRLLRKFEQK
jgi:hypothetical protein